MATKTIPQLTLRASLTDASMFEIDDGIQSYRVTATQLVTYFQTKELINAASMIAAGVITSAKFAALAVDTAALANLAVTAAKLDDSFIKDLTNVVPVGADYFSIADASDSDKKKKAAVKLIRDAVVRAVTTTDSVGVDDETMKMSGASFTSTLPAIGSRPGKRFKYIHKGTALQKYTIVTTGSDTVGGLASGVFKLCTPGEVLILEEPVTGTDWHIAGRVTDVGVISTGVLEVSATSAYVFSWTGSQNIVIGDIYSDGTNEYIVGVSSNTTSGAFAGYATPATTGTLTRVSGTGVSSVAWTSRTITQQCAKGTTVLDAITLERNGRYAKVRVRLQTNNSGAATGTGAYIFKLPANAPADLNYHSIYTGTSVDSISNTASFIGMGRGWDGGPMTKRLEGMLWDTTHFRLLNAGHATVAFQGSPNGGYAAATNAYDITLIFVVTDWQP